MREHLRVLTGTHFRTGDPVVRRHPSTGPRLGSGRKEEGRHKPDDPDHGERRHRPGVRGGPRLRRPRRGWCRRSRCRTTSRDWRRSATAPRSRLSSAESGTCLEAELLENTRLRAQARGVTALQTSSEAMSSPQEDVQHNRPDDRDEEHESDRDEYRDVVGLPRKRPRDAIDAELGETERRLEVRSRRALDSRSELRAMG